MGPEPATHHVVGVFEDLWTEKTVVGGWMKTVLRSYWGGRQGGGRGGRGPVAGEILIVLEIGVLGGVTIIDA